MDIGQAIHALRQARGWTQEELAFNCNTTAATISRIEAGKAMPGWTLLQGLADVFGLKLFQLIALAEGVQLPTEPALYDQREERLLQRYRRMAKDRQTLYAALAEMLADHPA